MLCVISMDSHFLDRKSQWKKEGNILWIPLIEKVNMLREIQLKRE